MSGLAGVFYFDGRPAGPEPLGSILTRLAHRGPDGCATWIDGSVALGFRAMHTTPEAVHEHQPFVKGKLGIVFHGRLDNRDELRKALAPAGDGDAELALLACEKWGEDAPGRLLGDFAFAYWDAARRRLLCARDWIGARPLAYAVHAGRLVFASEPGALFGDAGLPREPNEGVIGEFLANAVTHREETVWKGVLRLPPSHVLVADAAGVRARQYAPRSVSDVSGLASDLEYGNRFRELFRAAVLCRLRSNTPVCADLSGGLDSSSVVGMAQALFREGAAEGKGFETFSLSFPGRPCDERAYIDEVVSMWGLQANFEEAAAADPGIYAASAARTLDFPGYPNSAVALPIRPLARKRGFRAVLTGIGSDEWLMGPGPRRGGVLRAALRAVLPHPAFETVAKVMGKRKAPAWISAEFARRISLVDRIHAKDRHRPLVPGAEAARRFAIDGTGWGQHMLEIDERDMAWHGLELRMPFYDRRLIEFALTVPREQLRRGAATKFVLRGGLRDLLPPAVRDRRTKADFSHLFAEAFRALGGERSFQSLTTAARGWTNTGPAASLYREFLREEAAGRMDQSRLMWPLWMIGGIEIWYSRAMAGITEP
ncbi:MAG: asparagine synthase-related protein [Planctomycetota bacterium]